MESRLILVVDDNPTLLVALREVLESDGHRVVAVDSGEAGIREFFAALERGQPFDVVVTDLGMPEVDGVSVANAVKKVSPGTPVILLTGWGQRLLSENDVPTSVDQVLPKPPRLEELRGAMGAICPSPKEARGAGGGDRQADDEPSAKKGPFGEPRSSTQVRFH